MSMFHELMMRKKEEIMYATIKGTLAENDGVFSGFSSSNYLQLQQAIPDLDNNSKLEIFIDCKIENYNSTNVFFGATNGDTYNIKCQIDTQKRLFGYIYNNTTSTRLITPAIWSSSAIENSRLQIKYTISNNVLRVERSIDGSSFYGTEVSLGENFTYTKGIKLCLGKVLDGSIDLNNSYIKLGSTKYNLQAVVGYTVVGSPTITDGVVSGFSGSDYLMTSSNYTTNNMNNDDYEFGIKLTPTSSMSSECYAIKYYNNSTVRGIGIHNNKFIWSVGQPNTTGHQVSIVSSFNVTTNTTYWLKGIYKNKIASLYYSLDGTNYTLIGSIDETDQTFKITSAFNFGATAGSSYGLFLGSIDMKETYIKINNKL